MSPRSVRRDIDQLRELGYPVASRPGPGGHYQLTAGASVPPLLLDDGEAVAVAVGLRLATGVSVVDDLDDGSSQRALRKLEQVLPPRLRARRDVEPYRQVLVRGRWYLLAYDRDRDDWRTFRLDRIEAVVATGLGFRARALPAESAAAYLDARLRAARHHAVVSRPGRAG